MRTLESYTATRRHYARQTRPTLKFSPITHADIPVINHLLQRCTSRTCDYTIGGILMWVDYFRYQYCILEDTLFIKGVAEGHRDVTAFSLPIGPMPLRRAVGYIMEYCRNQGIRPVFSAIPEDKIEYLMSVLGDLEIRTEELTDWADYLYDIDTLSTLAGKKMSKKRNHVNRFVSENPHYTLEHLDSRNMPEVYRFLSRRDIGDKEDSETAKYELEECKRVLRSYNAFPFVGGVLRAEDGQVVAFTVGEVIDDTLYLHIEKADHNVPGAGETINKLFAADMHLRHRGIRYINREEDTGDPGLRYAKESYHPAMLLKKYNIYA